jgi:hypothetical protein
LQANLVNCQENQSVLEQSRSISTHFQHGFRSRDRGVVRFLAICVLDAEHNQASVSVVSDFLAGLRERVNTVKVSTLALES